MCPGTFLSTVLTAVEAVSHKGELSRCVGRRNAVSQPDKVPDAGSLLRGEEAGVESGNKQTNPNKQGGLQPVVNAVQD